MNLMNIEAIFECKQFAVHELLIDNLMVHRTAVPSTVGVILHDPVNDYLALENVQDLSTFTNNEQLPELEQQGIESAHDTVTRYCEQLGTTIKSISFVQTIASDWASSSKQVTLMYVVIDSRTVPEGTFVESTGTHAIRKLGRETIGAPLAIAAHYLKLVRLRKA